MLALRVDGRGKPRPYRGDSNVTGLSDRSRTARGAEDPPLQLSQDAGLPDTHRRAPHKPGESPALRGLEKGAAVLRPYMGKDRRGAPYLAFTVQREYTLISL